MKFNDFDTKMRIYEQSLDKTIPPENYIVARLDGRAFTKFTKLMNYEKPFDTNFRDIMVETTRFLMTDSGFNFIYGYTESDEISLLFSKSDNTFNRKERKIITTLAGEASAKISQLTGAIVSMDCRIAPLPNEDVVLDYFAWRQEDSHRNSLNAWCYWTLRQQGLLSKRKATSMLLNKGNSYKNELLFQYGINYNDLPKWQKAGIGIYKHQIEKVGYNPINKSITKVLRNELYTDYNIPIKEEYRSWLNTLLKEA